MSDASDPLELKPISRAAVPAAIDKAERYRLLNEPEQAESICLDILAVDPRNQKALVVLILAMSDQFAAAGQGATPQMTQRYVDALEDEYQRLYYSGIVCEREGRSSLGQMHGQRYAYGALRNAMDLYEQADALSQAENSDPKLRYNACLRVIRREELRPPSADEDCQLLE